MNVGSVIISTLVSALSCEHVDSFVFVDEHDRSKALMRELGSVLGTWQWPGGSDARAE